MNVQAIQEATRDAVKKKFGKKKQLTGKVVPRYPQSLEREYIRLVNAYMKQFSDTLSEHIPDVKAALAGYQGEAERTDRADASDRQDFSRVIRQVMDRIEADLRKRTANFDLLQTLDALENRARKYSIREWKRIVRQTLGINIFDDYYKGEFFRLSTRRWAQLNVDLIKSIPSDTLKRMTNIVQGGYYAGRSTVEIAQQIQYAYDVSKSRARFIARDQMAKLNAQITQQQHADAGVTKYVWRTSGDARVRDCHRSLNNKRFSYADPPVVDEKSGRRAHPGEDYQCRCVALPVFDLDSIVLPWESTAD